MIRLSSGVEQVVIFKCYSAKFAKVFDRKALLEKQQHIIKSSQILTTNAKLLYSLISIFLSFYDVL